MAEAEKLNASKPKVASFFDAYVKAISMIARPPNPYGKASKAMMKMNDVG